MSKSGSFGEFSRRVTEAETYGARKRDTAHCVSSAEGSSDALKTVLGLNGWLGHAEEAFRPT